MVGRLSGIRTQSGVVATWGSRTLVKPPCLLGNAGHAPTFDLYPGIRLTTEEKSPQNLSQGSRTVPDCGLQRKYLASCRNKGFPGTANFQSKLSVRALTRSARNELLNPREFACYCCTKVHQ